MPVIYHKDVEDTNTPFTIGIEVVQVKQRFHVFIHREFIHINSTSPQRHPNANEDMD
jgi:hypothetical protein